MFYLLVVFNLWQGFLQLLASTLATYAVARTVKTSYMPWLIFM